ncbi:MAG: DUF3754 domain-containing protein [Thermoguttaceae bacterium]|nr:DUF3754 domain-containing protein [Thermoguttaceae bacterium]
MNLETETLSRVFFVGRREGEVVVKLFKNLPAEDLKLTAPSVKFKFRWGDGLKIGGTFGGAVISPIVKLIAGAAGGLFVVFLLVFGFVVGGVKSFFGLLRRRTQFMRTYAERLYFNSLANNRAALSLLVSMAEEQEVKEIVLGYFAAESLGRWATAEEIDAAAEKWLAEKFRLDVDFESDDALRKLTEKRLVEVRETPRGPEYRAAELGDALKALDEDWDNYRCFGEGKRR